METVFRYIFQRTVWNRNKRIASIFPCAFSLGLTLKHRAKSEREKQVRGQPRATITGQQVLLVSGGVLRLFAAGDGKRN